MRAGVSLALWLGVPMASAVAALLVWAAGGNQAVFLTVNQALKGLPPALWAGLSQLGWAGSALAALSPVLWWGLRQGRVGHAQGLVLGLAVGMPLAGLASRVVKETVQMDRPAAALAEGSFHLIGPVLKAVAFPSGHTVTAFAMAAVLVWAWVRHPGEGEAGGAPRRAWATPVAALGMACLIGLSRIAMGAHWPWDVCGGAAIGWLGGLAGAVLAERWLAHRAWVRRALLPAALGLLALIGLALLLLPAEYAIVALFQRALGMLAMGVAAASTWVWRVQRLAQRLT
jgi:membrane-associated phospholipid phosphatase